MHENADLVLGLKKMYELEELVSIRNSCFKYLNRSLPLYAKQKVIHKPTKTKLYKC